MQNSNKKRKNTLHTSQRGITLIALIITIIVMLILVGVTINVALNGGLFDKADEAKKLTLLRADEEELQIEIATAYDEKERIVRFNTLKDNLKAKKWEVTESGDKLICTSKNGNTFTVDKKGEVTEGGNNSVGGNKPVAFDWTTVGLPVDTNTDYRSEEGITLKFTPGGIVTAMDNDELLIEVDATNPDNIEQIDQDTKRLKSVEIPIAEGINAMGTIVMNGTNVDLILTATIGGTTQTETYTAIKQEYDYSNEEVLKMVGETNSTGTYTDSWVILESDENGEPTKLVSRIPVTYYTLGYDDPKAIGENDLEKSIWSYKNVMNTLNEQAQIATGISDARTITRKDLFDKIDYTYTERLYKYYYDENSKKIECKYYDEANGSWSDLWFVINYPSSIRIVNDDMQEVVIDSNSIGEEFVLRKSITLYDFSDEQEGIMGILAKSDYWLPEQGFSMDINGGRFSMNYMSNTCAEINSLFSVFGDVYSSTHGVHAVIDITNN